jgi:hypothetical protein
VPSVSAAHELASTERGGAALGAPDSGTDVRFRPVDRLVWCYRLSDISVIPASNLSKLAWSLLRLAPVWPTKAGDWQAYPPRASQLTVRVGGRCLRNALLRDGLAVASEPRCLNGCS